MAIKILTNLRFAQTAGIAQTLSAFLDFVKENKKDILEISAVSITDSAKTYYRKSKNKNISVISARTKIPYIKDAVKKAKSIEGVKNTYSQVIETYRRAILEERPDLVLVNGTYYMPWCLFLAARQEKVPVVLHYHGVLAMETKNWPLKQRKIFLKMERCFDQKDIFYVFPSQITKNTVEQKIYKHKIKNCAVIPNPVPLHFFDADLKTDKVNIGIVGRWCGIKNVAFMEALAEYNKQQGGEFVINVVTDLKKKDKRYKKLSKTMKIHSAVDNKKLVDFYTNMGIVISPSHFETYGNVPKEALASGTPAIVSSNMGVAETFKKIGLQDWVMDFKSVVKVYKQIKNTIGSGVDESARRQLRESYCPAKIFGKLSTILESAIQN